MDYAACRVLCAAVLASAVKAARKGDKEAAAWLFTAEAWWWASWLGVEWPPHTAGCIVDL